ncbi:hypothetical protein J2Z31_004796 [Sinorhizobium kostiense]|uniref:Uncharacterized protein n=1 Tax=Sinorhizobium kostiense TaxID=76747 RepID=A0ABS4R5V3_9HYPH|nr:hypothetical protein [Sinorhizobium kostiense]MBP2238269.1 hypothetical protein [Sinorhizobium kostiense]
MIVLAFVFCSATSLSMPALAADTACGAVQTTMRKLNEAPKVHLAVRVVNDGFGYSSSGQAVLINTKQYHSVEGGPWHVNKRVYISPESVRNCEFIRRETLEGVATSLYRYERLYDQQTDRIEIWISANTGLPVQSHFTAISPKNGAERHLKYSYGSGIKEPI